MDPNPVSPVSLEEERRTSVEGRSCGDRETHVQAKGRGLNPVNILIADF